MVVHQSRVMHSNVVIIVFNYALASESECAQHGKLEDVLTASAKLRDALSTCFSAILLLI